MAAGTKVSWLAHPEDKDYVAAASYLSLLVAPDRLAPLIDQLRSAPQSRWAAKDVLRAAELAPLKPKASAEVAEKLKHIRKGRAISPILLVGGLRGPVVIADGYHRVSAAYRVDEDCMVPGRLLWTS